MTRFFCVVSRTYKQKQWVSVAYNSVSVIIIETFCLSAPEVTDWAILAWSEFYSKNIMLPCKATFGNRVNEPSFKFPNVSPMVRRAILKGYSDTD